MKELYLDAELEIVKFSLVDIITTSNEETLPEGTDPTIDPPTDPDEGELDIF